MAGFGLSDLGRFFFGEDEKKPAPSRTAAPTQRPAPAPRQQAPRQQAPRQEPKPQSGFGDLSLSIFSDTPQPRAGTARTNAPRQGNSLLPQLQSQLNSINSELNSLSKTKPSLASADPRFDPVLRRRNELTEQRDRLMQRVDRVRRTGTDYADKNDPGALDTARNFVAGGVRGLSNLVLGTAGDVAKLAGADQDNALSTLDKWVKTHVADALETTGGRQRREDSGRRVADAGRRADTGGASGFAKGMAAEISGTVREIVNSPGDVALPMIAEQIPNLLGLSAIGRGTAKAAGRRALAKGASTEAAAKVARKAGTRAVVGTGAVMQGADVGGDAFDRVMALPIEKLQADPDFGAYLDEGLSVDEAREALARNVGRKVGAASAAISVITNKYMPTAEKTAIGAAVGKTRVGRAVSTGVGEAGQEVLEEGGGQLASNIGIRSIDPDQRLGEGVGQSVAQAAIASGPIGAVTGAISPAAPEVTGSADNIATPELETALRTSIPENRAPEGPMSLPSPQRFDIDNASNDTPLRVKGLNLTHRQVLESAQQNAEDPRISGILDQPVDPDTKAEQIARVYNGEEARRAESLVVPKIAPIIGGKTPLSQTRTAIVNELSQFDDEVISESPVLSAMRDAVTVGENGMPAMSGKQSLEALRGAIAGYRPVTQQGQTFVARPERGGDGSVVMTQDQVAEEVQREREADQAFRLADARQRRYEQQTFTGGQREDLRPNAPEPQDQFFLDPAKYGEQLGGTPATITESTERPGFFRIQYDSPTEVINGQPVTISEEVPATALIGRVVRGSPRMTQDFVGDQRSLKAGVGTEMAGPRNSIDRTSSRSMTETPFAGLPAERMAEPDLQYMGTMDAQQQPVEEMPYIGGDVGAPPAPTPADNQRAIDSVSKAAKQLAAPKVEAEPAQEAAPVAKDEQPDVAEEDMLDVEDHPRMAEHNQRFDDAIERIQETENTSEARKLAKALIKEGLIDEDAYMDIDERIKDADREDKHYEAMSAIEDAIEEQRDNVGNDIADEIRNEDPRYYSKRETKTATKAEPKTDNTMSAEEAKSIIDDAISKLKARGQLGRVAAARVESLLDNKSMSANEAVAAFRMADVASKIVKSRLNLDIQFFPNLNDPKTGEKVQGSFQPLPLGGDGFAGVIKLSLASEWAGVFTETAAHEVFHAMQRVLQTADPKTFALLNSSFKDGMTLEDIHPSLQRLFKNTQHPRFEESVWDVMKGDAIFQNADGSMRQWSGYGPMEDSLTELQAYVFGYMNDAIRYGASRKGLAAQFSKAYDLFTQLLEGVRNGIKGLGFTSTTKLWRDVASGRVSERVGEADIAGEQEPVQFSARTRNMASLERTFQMLEKRTFKTGRDLKTFIQNRIKPSLESAEIDVTDFESEKLLKYLSKSVVNDAEFALKDNANAVGWYDEKVSKALAVLSTVHPEIATDPRSKFAFVWALAVTSNGLKVNPNFELAEKAYSTYKNTGVMPNNIGIGTASDAINNSLALFNTMMDRMGFEELERFMTTKATVKEIEAKTGMSISGEGKNEEVFGAAILGPKIGNGFFANLYGNFDQLTMDRWLMRTWGRWNGNLIQIDQVNIDKSRERLQSLIGGLNESDKKTLSDVIKIDVSTGDIDEIAVAINKASIKPAARSKINEIAVGNGDFLKTVLGAPKGNAKHVGIGDSIRKAGNGLAKYLDGQKEAPAGANERKFIRKVFGTALKTLQKSYPKLTMADLQALLWYPEKRLYEAAKADEVEKGYEDDNAPDYANAAVLVARNAGVGAERIQEALARVDAGRGSDVGAGGAGRGNSRVSGDTVQYSARPERIADRLARDFPSTPRVEEGLAGEGNVGRRRGGVLADSVTGRVPVAATYSHADSVKSALTELGISAPDFHELTTGAASARLYSRLINDSKADNPFGASVYVYPQEEYAGMRLFVTNDGLAGFALKGDDIVSAFKSPKSTEQGVAYSMIRMAVALGGRRLDAFDTVLPTIYSVSKFRAVSRMTWNDEYAPEDWSKKTFAAFNNGEPDVVFMAYDENRTGIYESGEGETVTDYDEAVSRQTAAANGTQFSRRTSTPEFREWFGKSVLVDDNGNPQMLFHGTGDNIDRFDLNNPNRKDTGYLGTGVYLTDEPFIANTYANLKQRNKTGANVLPLYARLENPFYATMEDKTRMRNGGRKAADAFTAELKAKGHDGVILEARGGGREIVVFDPAAVKSVNNRGTFSRTDDRILNSKRRSVPTGTPNATPMRAAPRFAMDNLYFGGPEPSTMDDVIYQLQDKLVDVKRLQASIEKSGKQIGEDANVYRAEELYHGRAAKRAKDFVERELNPLIEDMSSKGIGLDMFDKFLHMRHAKERNAQIRKVNPDMQDGGSGVYDADVDAYMSALPNARRLQLEKLAKRVDSIIANTQKMLVEYGLETQDTIDTWNATYKSYVPLQREGFEEEMAGSGGQGLSIRGSSSRRAMGSDRSVVDILANVAMQRERAITRGERNIVGNAMVRLALQNPNDSFWFVIDPKSDTVEKAVKKLVDFGVDPMDAQNIMGAPVERFIDPRTGRLVVRPNVRVGSLPNVMATRIDGEDRFIIFNSRNPRAARTVASLKNLDTAQIGGLMNIVAKGTRYFAAINTQYNPAFGLYNLMRDISGAAINLSNTPLANKKAEVVRNVLSAGWGMYGDLRTERKGGTATSDWAKLAEEFELAGGKTGFRDMFRNSSERAESIESALNPGKTAEAWSKTGKPVFDWLSDFNEAIENSVRLSAYKAARDMGLSQEESASIAKNITVNFNRKGAMGTQAGMLYAFFNASVQGSARMLETLSGPTGKKIIAGGLLLGFVQAMALAAADFGDDEIPDWLKDKNLVIPTGDGKYLAIPMPLGYHAIPAFSRRAVEFFMSGNKSAVGEVTELLGVFADAFNPIGNGGTLAETLSPTLGDPVIQLATNRDFAGRPIYQQDFNSLDPTPGPDRTRDGASLIGEYTAIAIDRFFGGNGYVPGTFSPTGDQVDFVIGTATGGAGRTVLNAISSAKAGVTGEDLPNYKIPIVGRMIGDKNEAAAVSTRFYEGLREVNGYQRTLKGMEEDGVDPSDYLSDNPAAMFAEDAADYERTITALKKERKQLIEGDASKEDVALKSEELQQLMAEFNQRLADYKKSGE